MSKVQYQNKKGTQTLSNRLSYPEAVNERLFIQIASGDYEMFLPLERNDKGKHTTLVCSASGLITLSEYVSGYLPKSAFFDLTHQLVSVLRLCERNRISPNNLALGKDTVFLDPGTLRVKFVYWPLVNNQLEQQPQQFLRELGGFFLPDPRENNSYLAEYNAYFASSRLFSLTDFEHLLARLEETQQTRSTSQTGSYLTRSYDSDNQVSRSGAFETFPPFEEDRIHCPVCGAPNPVHAEVCSACGNLLRRRETGSVKNAKAMVFRIRTQKMYPIETPFFTMGTDSSQCVCVITDNPYISRHHADIVSQNGGYYLVDRGSTNRTFANGGYLEPEKMLLLKSGDVFRMADEEFSFLCR